MSNKDIGDRKLQKRHNYRGYVSRPIADVKSRNQSLSMQDIRPKAVPSVENPKVVARPHVVLKHPKPPVSRQQQSLSHSNLHQSDPKNIKHSTIATVPTLPKPSRFKFLHSKKPITPFISKKFRRKRMARFTAVILLLIITPVIIISIISMRNAVLKNREQDRIAAKIAASAVVIKNSNDTFIEEVPSGKELANYQASPEAPKFLRINQIEILSRVVIAPQNSNTAINLASPKSIYDTVWYSNSAKPGENGAIVIGGNINGPTKQAILKNISLLKIGSRVVVARGDNTELVYKVVAIETVNANTFDKVKAFQPYDPKQQGLNIIASSLKDSKNALSISPSIVVYAIRDN